MALIVPDTSPRVSGRSFRARVLLEPVRFVVPPDGYVFVGRTLGPAGLLGNPWHVGDTCAPLATGRITPAAAVEAYRCWIQGLPLPEWAPPPRWHVEKALSLEAIEALRAMEATSPVSIGCPCNGWMRGQPCHAQVLAALIESREPVPVEVR